MIRVRRKPRAGELGSAARNAIELSDRHAAIANEIRDLEHFISAAPERAARKRLDRLETIPPPDDFHSDETVHVHPVSGLAYAPRLSRGQEQHMRRERRRNMLVFLSSAALLAGFAFWLSQTL